MSCCSSHYCSYIHAFFCTLLHRHKEISLLFDAYCGEFTALLMEKVGIYGKVHQYYSVNTLLIHIHTFGACQLPVDKSRAPVMLMSPSYFKYSWR